MDVGLVGSRKCVSMMDHSITVYGIKLVSLKPIVFFLSLIFWETALLYNTVGVCVAMNVYEFYTE